MVGSTGIKSLWLATVYDEWGIQNAPGTGLIMSEMIFEAAFFSPNYDSPDPKHFFAEIWCWEQSHTRCSGTVTHQQLRESWLLKIDPIIKVSKEMSMRTSADVAD